MWYAASANANATIVTAMATANITGIVTWRFTTPRPATVDMARAVTDPAASGTPSAPIATSAPGDIVVAAAVVAASPALITPGGEFASDETPNGDGFAHLTNPLAPAGVHVAVWDQAFSASYCAAAVAFAVGP
jgi:hypothetical protein